MSAGLLALSLAVAGPTAETGLQSGDEFTFAGTVAEELRRAPDFFRRRHSLELRVLVLERQEKWADAIVLTRLQRKADAVAGVVGAVTGDGGEKDLPPLVRLDLVRVHADGTVHVLLPPGPAPLTLSAETPAHAVPLVPIDSYAPFEFGMFPPRTSRVSDGETWTVASPGNRPAETWWVRGSEAVNAEVCRVLIMNQKSAGWDRPVGGQTAWHRADKVCVSAQDGTARRVHRVIKQRDGRDEQPVAWVEVKYELQHHTRLAGRTFDRTRHDAEVAYAALADSLILVPQATKLGPRPFDTRMASLDAHLAQMDGSSPYREALLAARRSFEAARQGKVLPASPAAITLPALAPARGRWPEAGQAAPDFLAGAFRLADHKGKPVVLVFVRPGGETTDLTLAIAAALEKRYTGKVVVATLVVFGDVATAVAARDRLKSELALHDGAATANVYGVETAPRFAVIDAGGTVRWTFTGVGAETGHLLKEEVDGLVRPVFPAGSGGRIELTVPPMSAPSPRR